MQDGPSSLAHGAQDGPPALTHGTQDGPSSASQQGQRVEPVAHGVLPQQTSLGWPQDGERILWDSDRLACVWRHVQRFHIQQKGQHLSHLDLEGLVGELGLRHPLQRYNAAVRLRYFDLKNKFDNTGVTPSLEGGRPRLQYQRLPFCLSDKIKQILLSMPGCVGSHSDITKALKEDLQVIPHIDRRVHDSYK